MTNALVTGATRAPGRAIATMLAKEGWEVHAPGRDRIELDEMRSEHAAVPPAVDLRDREYTPAVAEGLEPDVFVHAALRWSEETHFPGLAEAGIDTALEVDLSATLPITRAILPLLIERRRGAFGMLSMAMRTRKARPTALHAPLPTKSGTADFLSTISLRESRLSGIWVCSSLVAIGANFSISYH